MRFEVRLLGTNAAVPTPGRFSTSQVLHLESSAYLIDCGEGAQVRMQQFQVNPSRIGQVFISHLHGDHIYGLAGFLTSQMLMGRQKGIELFGPSGLEDFVTAQLKYSFTKLPFPIAFHVVDTDNPALVFEDRHIMVYSLPLLHRIPATGYLFRESPRDRNIRPEMILAYGLSVEQIVAAKKGADIHLPDGRLLLNAEITIDPPPSRSYAFCTDTAFHPDLVPLVRGVDLLYHESTFCSDLQDHARLTGHSTARDAAEIALAAGVKRLILGHFSSRYSDMGVFESEARAIFPDAFASKDGDVFEVPFRS